MTVYKVHYYSSSAEKSRIERKNYISEDEAKKQAQSRRDAGQYAGYFLRSK